MTETPKYFRPRNWQKWQGYKKRGPKWIQLHVALLDDPDFGTLTELQQCHLIKIWMLYAKSEKPLPWVTAWLGPRLGAVSKHLGRSLKVLESIGFIELEEKSVAKPSQQTETETYTEKKRKTPSESKERKSVPAKRGTRLSQNWTPTKDEIHFACQAGLEIGQVRSIAEQFRDYWIAQPGQKGVKLDWTATWRNWVRRTDRRKMGGAAQPPPNWTPEARVNGLIGMMGQGNGRHDAQPSDQLLLGADGIDGNQDSDNSAGSRGLPECAGRMGGRSTDVQQRNLEARSPEDSQERE